MTAGPPVAQAKSADAPAPPLVPLEDTPRPEGRTEEIVEREAEPPPAERELSSELLRALRDLRPCFADPAAAGPDPMRVEITVYVTPTGMVTRAEATVPGGSPEVRRCVEASAMAVRLQPPIPDAPRAVHASLTVQRPAAAKEAPAPAAWRPTSGVPIQGDPPLPPSPAPAAPISGPPGVELQGPAPRPIQPAPALDPTGPPGLPPSH
jgi:hypothetical protein